MFKLIEPKKEEEEHIELMVESMVILLLDYFIAYLSSNCHIEMWASEK